MSKFSRKFLFVLAALFVAPHAFAGIGTLGAGPDVYAPNENAMLKTVLVDCHTDKMALSPCRAHGEVIESRFYERVFKNDYLETCVRRSAQGMVANPFDGFLLIRHLGIYVPMVRASDGSVKKRTTAGGSFSAHSVGAAMDLSEVRIEGKVFNHLHDLEEYYGQVYVPHFGKKPPTDDSSGTTFVGVESYLNSFLISPQGKATKFEAFWIPLIACLNEKALTVDVTQELSERGRPGLHSNHIHIRN